MLWLLLIFPFVLSEVNHLRHLYAESLFDPIVTSTADNISNTERISKRRGFFINHSPENIPNSNEFGDLNIITFNDYRKIVVVSETPKLIDDITQILDRNHPTFLLLQGVDKQTLEELGKRIGLQQHYGMINTDEYEIDASTGGHYFLPIIYDKHLVKITKSGFFKTIETNSIYASYAVISDFRFNPKKENAYIIINVDLVQTHKNVIKAELANILTDIQEIGSIKNKPIFIAGGIGTTTPEMDNLFKVTYKNLINLDFNNSNISRGTVHGFRDFNDDVQRDFILLKDSSSVFTLNYARILTDASFLSEHYAVEAILTINSSFTGEKI